MEALESNPVLVEVTRGDGVESCHRGAAGVVNAAGGIVASWGNIKAHVFPRSAIKAI
jgi:L-asparaginase II